MELGYELQEFSPGLRVQAGHGLVEHQHLRVHGQHARERDAPLLAAGKLEGAFGLQRVEVQPHAFQGAPHAPVHFLGV